MFIEYPKALYKDGLIEDGREGEYVTVHSKKDEELLNQEGFYEAGKAPRNKPVKVEEPDPMDPLRVEAVGLGIDIDHRWGEKRLQTEIDKVKKAKK